MLILHDPTTLLHETVELLGAKLQPALESPDRLRSILNSLRSADSTHQLCEIVFSEAGAERWRQLDGALRATHAEDYLEHLKTAHRLWVKEGLVDESESVLPESFPLQSSSVSMSRARQPPKDIFARAGYYAFDMSSGLANYSWDATIASANLAVTAVDELLLHQTTGRKTVMALCRPPGHHCDTKKAGGYCYVNNAVVAVQALRTHQTSSVESKVAILDLDFHHGNGTQDYFYNCGSTLYISIHGKDEYPYYTGFEDEVGAGKGRGFNMNLPLEVGSSIDKYLEQVDVMVHRTKDFKPAYVVVSLGFDTFMLDPLGKFQIDTEDYAVIGQKVRASLSNVPAVILLEGGYVVDRLGANLLSFLKGWEAGEEQD